MHSTARPVVSQPARTLNSIQHALDLGLAHAKRREWPLAVVQFKKVCKAKPEDFLTRLNLGRALLRAGETHEAMVQMDLLIKQDPQNTLPYQLLAECHAKLGQHQDAATAMLRLPPDARPDALYLQNLGNTLLTAQKYQEAIKALLDALALDVTHAVTHYRLGLAFNFLGMKHEAVECWKTTIALQCELGDLASRSLLAFSLRELCRWDEASFYLDEMTRALEALPPDAAVWTSAFACVTLTDDMRLQRKAAESCINFSVKAIKPLPTAPTRPLPKRLRLGFVSADFHQHATTILMAELLEQLDHERFELYIYSHGPEDDGAMRKRVVAAADAFVEVRTISDEAVAKRIQSDQIDVLFDLKGHTINCRLGIFAYRPAPVQVSYLGFPGTSGGRFMDYFIGDSIVSPIEDAPFYTEKLALMPNCYQPNDRQRALPQPTTRQDHGLPDGALVLCGFNQPFKVSPEVLDVWCDLLNERPDAVLWLLQWNDDCVSALQEQASQRGVDPARIIFAPKLSSAAHLSRFALADIYLDTWPCNGHTTASDALWASVPMVTYAGPSFASRVASSLLHAVGLAELVAHDLDDYKAKALSLADDASKRQAIRKHLVNAREQSPLFDSVQYAKDFGDLVWRMAERHAQGLPPDLLPAA
jgi:predicted O-linked N-acetylglucosamine transferase (SPINDLY family)